MIEVIRREKRNVMITFTCTMTMDLKIQEMADKLDVSKSEACRILLAQALHIENY